MLCEDTWTLAQPAEVRGCLVMKWLVRYHALWVGTWHLGKFLALISLSSPSFLMLVLTYRMGVMVLICLSEGFRSDVLNSGDFGRGIVASLPVDIQNVLALSVTQCSLV